MVTALLTGILYVAFRPAPSPAPTPTSGVHDGRFWYAPGNFMLTLQPGWEVADAADITLPSGFSNLGFAFKKTNSTCTLAYLSEQQPTETPPRGEYMQTTPGERVYVAGSQIDQWWWAPATVLPPGFKAGFSGRSPFPREILIGTVFFIVPTQPYAMFILYAQDKGTVSDDCATDAVAMYKTLSFNFASTTLNNGSSGFLRMLQSADLGGTIVGFKAQGSDEYKRVSADILRTSYVSVFNNRLYLLHHGSLLTLDIFTGKMTPLPGVATTSGAVVNDFYIKGDTLWYQRGREGCSDYMARCVLQVYETPVQGGTPRLLGETTLMSGAIMGYDSTARVLYLRSSFGDAGVYHYTIYAYSYADNSLTKVLEDSGSSEDPPAQHAAAQAQRAAIEAAIGPAPVSGDVVPVRAGRLGLPEDAADVPGSYKNFIFPR